MVPLVAIAQGPPGPPATPIDGGLGLLLAGGLAYGVKKIRDNRKAWFYYALRTYQRFHLYTDISSLW